MSESPVPGSRPTRWRSYFSLRQALLNTGFLFYGLAIFLAFDFAYSSFSHGEEKQHAARVADPH